jgi:hypothetical protein
MKDGFLALPTYKNELTDPRLLQLTDPRLLQEVGDLNFALLHFGVREKTSLQQISFFQLS